jgi:S-adenosylmethionine-diacylglycerol 3-amino-3-carboxypropyl transferase
LHCGRYEHYMGLLRRWLGMMIGTSTIETMLETRDQEQRSYLYDHRWNTILWRVFTRIFLSRRIMGHLFTDDFFTHVGESFSFGTHFREMTRKVLTGPLAIDNPYLSYILLGRFQNDRALPLYLRQENWEPIRSRISRVRTLTGRCEDVLAQMPADSIASFNFTNIFEWMPTELHEHVMRSAWRAGKPGAVVTYRNLLVERHRPPRLASAFDRHPALSARLHERDRSFIYRAYVVESVKKGGLSLDPGSTSSAAAKT